MVHSSEDCHSKVVTWYSDGVISHNDDDTKGLVPDLLKTISDQQPCQLTSTFLPIARLFAHLSNNQIDASIFVTPYGEEIIETVNRLPSRISKETVSARIRHTTPPLFHSRLGFFAKSDFSGKIYSESDLLDYKIGAIKVSIFSPESYRYYTGLAFTPEGFINRSAGFKSLLAGRLDLFFSSFAIYNSFVDTYQVNNLKLIKETKSSTFRLVFYKDISAEKAIAIDKVIIQLKESGQIQRIIQRHAKPESFLKE
ncbi:hypothetical protein R50073_33000 [Maricurvus nonylphenolicus]|uniref:substrate-binding periplasmic protein n=1 Tax=Maricurvus nonylphenolicus TaxID=1008307 RepID=UPI0036F271D3